jgi:hypothetical protein
MASNTRCTGGFCIGLARGPATDTCSTMPPSASPTEPLYVNLAGRPLLVVAMFVLNIWPFVLADYFFYLNFTPGVLSASLCISFSPRRSTGGFHWRMAAALAGRGPRTPHAPPPRPHHRLRDLLAAVRHAAEHPRALALIAI